jgi:LAO/AO transport system kinase
MDEINDKLINGIINGEERYIARGISLVENNRREGIELLKTLYQSTELAYIVGITGPPGSGKSTLSEKIVKEWRKSGKKVGIIAIDPSSQFSGGALLGDRIRMGKIVNDRGVFIRSMATRGMLGGLNPAIFDTIILLSAAGYEYILIETVGVGQNEVEVVNLADTILVVTVPESGDEIQSIKAGLMEAGDIFVVNKADLEGEKRMQLILKQMLSMKEAKEEKWIPPVLPTVATKSEGISNLVTNIYEHFKYLKDNNIFRDKRKELINKQAVKLMEHILLDKIIEPILNSRDYSEGIEEVIKHLNDPYSLVDRLLKRRLFQLTGSGKNED